MSPAFPYLLPPKPSGAGRADRLILFCRKQELLNSSDVTLPDRPLSPPLTAPPTMKVSARALRGGRCPLLLAVPARGCAVQAGCWFWKLKPAKSSTSNAATVPVWAVLSGAEVGGFWRSACSMFRHHQLQRGVCANGPDPALPVTLRNPEQ